MIDFIRVFDSALSDDEVKHMFTDGVVEDLDSLVFEWTKDYVACREGEFVIVSGRCGEI